jgi:hypothetical protein
MFIIGYRLTSFLPVRRVEDPILPGVFLCKGPERHSWVDADDAAKCCNGYTRERRVCRDADGTLKLEFYWQFAADGAAAPPPALVAETSRLVPPPRLDLVDDGPRRPARPEPAGPTTGPGLSHSAFFRRVAEMSDDDSPTWRALTAGLLTLRLVDRWAARHTTGRDPTFKEYVLVRRAINEVDDDRVHDVLRQLTDTLRDFSTGEAGSVPKLLFAYGLILEDGAEWPLAIDVYQTVLQHARRPADRDGLALVYNRLGYCLRQDRRWEDALGAYDTGVRIARAVGDTSGALRLRNAEANLVFDRGDYPKAVVMWETLIDEARTAGCRDVFARASHDRGCAAVSHDAFEEAASFLFVAMQAYEDATQRERASLDLAVAVLNLGIWDGARDAFYILHTTAEQHEVRMAAAINLLRLAAEDGERETFERYRALIDVPALSLRLRAEFYRRLAEGYGAFGERDVAAMLYRTLRQLAEQNDLEEYTQIAEAGLHGSRRLVRRAAPLPPALRQVVEHFRDLGERHRTLAAAHA